MGQRHPQPTLAEQAETLRYDAAVLVARGQRLELEAVAARAAAAAAHKAGNEPVARTHAGSMITARKSAATFYAMGARVRALATKLEAVEASAALAEHMATLAATLKTVTAASFQDIDATMVDFDKAMAGIEKATAAVDAGLDAHVGVSDADIDRELLHIHDSAGLELEADMPSVVGDTVLRPVEEEEPEQKLQDRYEMLLMPSPPTSSNP